MILYITGAIISALLGPFLGKVLRSVIVDDRGPTWMQDR